MKERRKTKRINEADKATIVLNSEICNQQVKKVYHVLLKTYPPEVLKSQSILSFPLIPA